MKKLFLVTAAAISTAVVPAVSFAAETTEIDLTALTSAISFGNVSTAVMAIAGTIAGLYAVYAGVRHVLRMVRSA